LRIVSIFKQREAERLDTIHKQSAAFTALVLHDPIAAGIFADHEQ
jgi:hypothetical protein